MTSLGGRRAALLASAGGVVLAFVVSAHPAGAGAASDRSSGTAAGKKAKRSPWRKPVPFGRPGFRYTITTSTGVAGDGSSLTVWPAPDGMWLRRRTRDGRLGPAQRISPRTHRRIGGDFSIAIGHDGAAVILWESRRGRYVRIRSADGRLGPVHRLDGEGLTSNFPRAVPFFGPADGHPRIVSGELGGPEEREGYFLETLDPAHGLRNRTALSRETAGEAAVAVDRAGNAVIVWEDGQFYSAFDEPEDGFRILASTLSRDGTLGSTITIARRKSCCAFVAPRVSVGPSGRGHVIWGNHVRGRLLSRPISTSGDLGPVATLAGNLAGNDFLGRQADVAAFADGRSLAVWTTIESPNRRGGPYRDKNPVRGRILTAGRAGAAFPISRRTDLASSFPHVVARGRRATVLWSYGVADRGRPDGFLGLKGRSVTVRRAKGRIATLRAKPVDGKTSLSAADLAIGARGSVVASWSEFVQRARRKDRVYFAATR